jgi:hypothetical protein
VEIFAREVGAPPESTTHVANYGNNIKLLTPQGELEGKIFFTLTLLPKDVKK